MTTHPLAKQAAKLLFINGGNQDHAAETIHTTAVQPILVKGDELEKQFRHLLHIVEQNTCFTLKDESDYAKAIKAWRDLKAGCGAPPKTDF